MKRLKCSILCVGMICNILFTGCSTEIKPDSKEEGVYATQNPLSAVEYSIYMNKQITVFTNQLTTRMIMANNAQESTYENEADMADESVIIMEDALEEVVVTYPSDTSEDDREAAIMAMQTAVDHMVSYAEDVRNGEDTTKYINVFQNDFNALTGLANLYYQ